MLSGILPPQPKASSPSFTHPSQRMKLLQSIFQNKSLSLPHKQKHCFQVLYELLMQNYSFHSRPLFPPRTRSAQKCASPCSGHGSYHQLMPRFFCPSKMRLQIPCQALHSGQNPLLTGADVWKEINFSYLLQMLRLPWCVLKWTQLFWQSYKSINS